VREYVETWKCIAAKIGRSERWCRYTSTRVELPLPVCAFGGNVRLYLDDYEAWELAECERGRVALATGGLKRLPQTERRSTRRAQGETGEVWVLAAIEARIRQIAQGRGVSRRFVADELVEALLDDVEKRPLTAAEIAACQAAARGGRRKDPNAMTGRVLVWPEVRDAIRRVAYKRGRSIGSVATKAIDVALDAAGAPR
jgi:hypothetical protein